MKTRIHGRAALDTRTILQIAWEQWRAINPHVTQTALARRARLPASSLSRALAGTPIRPATLQRLLAAMGFAVAVELYLEK